MIFLDLTPTTRVRSKWSKNITDSLKIRSLCSLVLFHHSAIFKSCISGNNGRCTVRILPQHRSYLNEGSPDARRQDDKEPVDEEDAGDGSQDDEPEPEEGVDLNGKP